MTSSEISNNNEELTIPKGGILSLTIKDKNTLYSAYMPYVLGGGLFIPTTKHYALGDEVFLLLTIMKDPAKLPVPARVIWITPAGFHGGSVSGVGVQFSAPDGVAAQNKIETALASTLKSERPHHAM